MTYGGAGGPVRVAVVGSGPGGLAIAADLAASGRAVVLADLPEFTSNLQAVRERGGVGVVSNWHGQSLQSVAVAESIEEAVAEAALTVVCVRAAAHERCVQRAIPALSTGSSLLFMGEGGGALVAHLLLMEAQRPDVVVGETNALPFVARLGAAGKVIADRKSGGVLLAGLPAPSGRALLESVSDVWPFLELASSIWDTVLLNFDAIDVVPVAISNAAILECRPGGMLLWGEGASPGVVGLIERLDAELLSLRLALGTTDPRCYREFLVAQGLAPPGPELYGVLRSSAMMRGVRPSGRPNDLAGLIEVPVAWSLVFAASIGEAVGVSTPVTASLVTLAGAILARDLVGEGRTLRSLGLDGLDADGLRRLAAEGWSPA